MVILNSLDMKTNKSLGKAFVEFKDVAAAEYAIVGKIHAFVH